MHNNYTAVHSGKVTLSGTFRCIPGKEVKQGYMAYCMYIFPVDSFVMI